MWVLASASGPAWFGLDSRRSAVEDDLGKRKGTQMLNRRGFASCALCAAVGLVASSGDGVSQVTPGFKRTILQKTEYPGDKHVCILAVVDVEPNALIPRHTHPGVESAFFQSGGGTLSVKGQADRLMKAGDGGQVPPETPHSLRNGPEASRIVVTWIVEKDKPLASPAPE
jgi:quercetin dioxygenase-like cupin family protein